MRLRNRLGAIPPEIPEACRCRESRLSGRQTAFILKDNERRSVKPETQVVYAHQKRFEGVPRWLLRAPGRVNLIGEHTDYNDGFVLPMAIDRWVWLAVRPREDRRVVCESLDMENVADFDLDRMDKDSEAWNEYLKGVAWALQDAGKELRGWEGVLKGDIPIGAGLSSSAALEMAAAKAFALASDLPWNPREMARLCQQAEREWVGVNCGVMDQMICALGEVDHGLLIDCRTLETEQIPLPRGCTILILDTGTRRGLRDSAYNERRRQCEQAARFFGVQALRDLSLDQFQPKAGQLEDVVRRRARHVISENERTLEAAQVMRAGDAGRLGALMDASHESLRVDYEVSSPVLNAIVRLARREHGCYGARLTGAGFAGCAVALVEENKAQQISESVSTSYHDETGLEASVYVCRAVRGVEVLPA